MVLAALKLRSRGLSPLVGGSGCAINRSKRLTQRQARFFWEAPKYPHVAREQADVWRWLALLGAHVRAASAWWFTVANGV